MQVEHRSFQVRRPELVGLAGLGDLARLDGDRGRGLLETAHAGTGHASREPQPERIAIGGRTGHIKLYGNELGRNAVALAAEHEIVDRYKQLEAPAGPGGQMQPA